MVKEVRILWQKVAEPTQEIRENGEIPNEASDPTPRAEIDRLMRAVFGV